MKAKMEMDYHVNKVENARLMFSSFARIPFELCNMALVYKPADSGNY